MIRCKSNWMYGCGLLWPFGRYSYYCVVLEAWKKEAGVRSSAIPGSERATREHRRCADGPFEVWSLWLLAAVVGRRKLRALFFLQICLCKVLQLWEKSAVCWWRACGHKYWRSLTEVFRWPDAKANAATSLICGETVRWIIYNKNIPQIKGSLQA